MKLCAMSEDQKALVKEKKMNVALMNVLRNLENEVAGKFSTMQAIRVVSRDLQRVLEETTTICGAHRNL